MLFEGVNASLVIERMGPAVVRLVIRGHDVGEHGEAPFTRLELELLKGPFLFFIDARDTRGATLDVSDAWARFLRMHKDAMLGIHMLTATRYVQLTADFVRCYAGLGDAMFVYTDAAAFDEALTVAANRHHAPIDPRAAIADRTPR